MTTWPRTPIVRRGMALGGSVLLALVGLPMTAAHADGSAPTIDTPANLDMFYGGEAHIEITVTPNDSTTLAVSLSVDQGDLTLASTTGLTFSEGDGTQDATLAFNGSNANVASALADVTYRPGAFVGAATLSAQVTDGGSLYFPTTGHFYQFVEDSGIAWADADTAASATSLYGLQGYLATVTSAEENDFVSAKLTGQGWMGASDAATEGEWRWVTGPEGAEDSGAGRVFYRDNLDCNFDPTGFADGPVDSQYNSWDSGEPNDYCPGEDYAHFLEVGDWNDYPADYWAIAGYVVEYGGMAGDASTVSTDSTAIIANATAPGAPTITDTTPGSGQVAVTWDAPASNGGAPITGYTVTATPGGATESVDGATTTATVTGLTNGTTYTFTVTATSGAGTSEASAGESATPVAVPGAPSITSAVEGNARVGLTWTAPASNGGSPITGYTVHATPGGITKGLGGSSLSTTMTNLTNGTTYTFTVTATNAVGTGAASAGVAATPEEPPVDTVPAPPDITEVTPGYRQLTVGWDAPDDGGSTITGYTVRAEPAAGAWSAAARSGSGAVEIDVDGDTTTAVVNGLENGTEYDVTVTATNAVGTSDESDPVSGTPFSQPISLPPSTPWPGDADPVPAPDAPDGVDLISVTPTPDGGGSWGVAPDGGVFTGGDAPFFGSLAGTPLAAPIIGLAPTPTGNGYLLAGADGGVFAFGDAGFHGSMAGTDLAAPITGIASTCSGGGYYLVGADGGVFAFGDAEYLGSMAGTQLFGEVIAIVPTCSGHGYWLVARDGGVFTFGDAHFHGSLGTQGGAETVGLVPIPSGHGYWLLRRDGTQVPFGEAA